MTPKQHDRLSYMQQVGEPQGQPRNAVLDQDGVAALLTNILLINSLAHSALEWVGANTGKRKTNQL